MSQCSNEIVISFAGTDPGDIGGDIAADVALAAGMLSDQLKQAADYYLQVKASAPAGATINFTGHSLGGGLASLMAVLFNESAFTFDQAPFLNAAQTFNTVGPDGSIVQHSAAKDLRTYLTGRAPETLLATLDAYIAAAEPFNPNPNPADTLAARNGLVTNINTQGEFLSSWFLVPSSNRIGSQAEIPNSNDGVSGLNLHSQALLTAFLQSNQTADANRSLSDVTFRLTDLLKMIFDPKLFSYSTDKSNDKDVNFLEHLVRHQAGGIGGVPTGGDTMVTRFTADLWKLAQDGGLTLTDKSLADALTAFAMQFYYENTANAQDPNKQLFTDIATEGGSNGIRFDLHDVSKDIAAKMDANAQVDLAAVKHGKYILKGYYLNSGDTVAGDNTFPNGPLSLTERAVIKSMLPALRDWYIQAGTGGMTATDTLNRGAFMLGGSGADTLTGGTVNDLLVGNAGADTLAGGKGTDVLIGGAGNDIYQYTGAATNQDGLDIVLDSDGNGRIEIDGAAVAGGAQYGDDRVHRDEAGHLYVNTGNSLLVNGNLLVMDWQAGDLGINMTGAVADASLPVLAGNDQDNFIGKDVYNRDPARSGSVILPNGSTGLQNAWVDSNDGANTLEGGLGVDILSGGGGNDRLYGNVQIDIAEAITQGNQQSGNGARGDWLNGGSGDDILAGSLTNDVLVGGGGQDLIVAGAGDDDIVGDYDVVAQSFVWTSTIQPGGNLLYSPADGYLYPPDAGADVIYAGEGNDRAWGGQGNDVIFGEGGSDSLNGDEGNDILLAGAGDDKIWGGVGDDYLDGGNDVDTLYGDAGNDILVGGKGNDKLYGGEGNDIYIYNRGDGNDYFGELTSGNTLRFGAGIGANEITLRLGSLMLDLGNGDAVHIGNFNQNDVFNSSMVGSFEFADGTVRMRWRNCAEIICNIKAANDGSTCIWGAAA